MTMKAKLLEKLIDFLHESPAALDGMPEGKDKDDGVEVSAVKVEAQPEDEAMEEEMEEPASEEAAEPVAEEVSEDEEELEPGIDPRLKRLGILSKLRG